MLFYYNYRYFILFTIRRIRSMLRNWCIFYLLTFAFHSTVITNIYNSSLVIHNMYNITTLKIVTSFFFVFLLMAYYCLLHTITPRLYSVSLYYFVIDIFFVLCRFYDRYKPFTPIFYNIKYFGCLVCFIKLGSAFPLFDIHLKIIF